MSDPDQPLEALPNHTCPLCGQPNDCAPARSGSLHVECWCREVRFNPESLARVPEEYRNKACLCRKCAEHPPESSSS